MTVTISNNWSDHIDEVGFINQAEALAYMRKIFFEDILDCDIIDDDTWLDLDAAQVKIGTRIIQYQLGG